MTALTLGSLLAWGAVVLSAYLRRGRPFVYFAAVLVGIHTLVSVALAPPEGPLRWAYAALQAAVYLHYFRLAAPRMRSLAYRALVSVPAHWFAASTMLGLPWALAHAFGFSPRWQWVPYAAGALGLLQSLYTHDREVDVVLGGSDAGPKPRRLRRGEKRAPGDRRVLRVVQVSDPHLGPFMSVERLRSICARAVASQPDLVLLTGDFLTMESQAEPSHLRDALEPLAALRGKVFACFGNHDHEAPATVRGALAAHGVTLLVDELTTAQTPHGEVELLGFDFHWRERKEKMAEVCARYPRREGVVRLAMLHDPGAFRHLPEGAADLVFSGHTHGGQVGLVTLGLPYTFLSLVSSIPDHGLWGRGRDRLYVHRGTGHYGFPLRVGVPAEQGELRVHLPA